MQTTRPGNVPFFADSTRSTLLLGLHEELDVLIAWSVGAHPNPGASSSLQVSLNTIEEAAAAGTSSQARKLATQDEVVFACRVGLIGDLIEGLPELEVAMTSDGETGPAVEILRGADPDAVDPPPEQSRRVALRRVATLVRDARFRVAVVEAHKGACAFCGLGFGIVEAAHIRPVSQGGSDSVANGLAACPSHHKAFDRGLLIVEAPATPVVNVGLATRLGIASEDIDRFEKDLLPQLPGRPPGTLPLDLKALAEHYERWHVV